MAKGRHAKGGQRARKLTKLQVKSTSIRVRLFNGSIRSSALYGHEGVGVAPKRRKWFRSLLAAALGRPTLASTDSALEFHSNKVVDPAYTILSQHFKAIRRLLLSWPDRDIGRLHQSWNKLGQWLSEAEHPWKRAAGPLGAAWCYLQELGWEAISLSKWRVEGDILDIRQGPDFHRLLFQLKHLIDTRRHRRIAQSDGGKGLETGPDWTAPRRLLKQANKQEKAALQALWQGAVKASPTATCSLRNLPATKKHVLWECKWWKKHGEQPPRWWEDYPEHQSTDCLWNFGLMPNLPREMPSGDSILEVQGVLRNPDQIPEGAFAATDASGGPTTDHRLQTVVWGLIVYEWCGDTPKRIGSIAGLLDNEQSVYRGEAKAIQQAALLLPEGTDVTSDCKGAVARARRGPAGGGAHQDIFGTAPTHELRLTWVPSHLGCEEFKTKIGEGQEWRRNINAEVDALVSRHAKALYSTERAERLQKHDKLATDVASFLGRRLLSLLEGGKKDGPQVVFPKDQPQEEPANPPSSSPSSNQSTFSKNRWKKRRKIPRGNQATTGLDSPTVNPADGIPGGDATTARPEETGSLNKKQILTGLVQGTLDVKGHTFVITRNTVNNLQIKCENCGLWIQQVDTKDTFNRKTHNHCKGHPDSVPSPTWTWHASHVMVNEGNRWVCTKCSSTQSVGGLTHGPLERPCQHAPNKRPPTNALKLNKAAQGTPSVATFFGGPRNG